MSSSWNRTALQPTIGVLVRDQRGDADAEEEPHEDGGGDGGMRPPALGTPGALDAGRGAQMSGLQSWDRMDSYCEPPCF